MVKVTSPVAVSRAIATQLRPPILGTMAAVARLKPWCFQRHTVGLDTGPH